MGSLGNWEYKSEIQVTDINKDVRFDRLAKYITEAAVKLGGESWEFVSHSYFDGRSASPEVILTMVFRRPVE
jgi:hypothetical protein